MPFVVAIPGRPQKRWRNGKARKSVKVKTSWVIWQHADFRRLFPRPKPDIRSNASLWKVTEELQGDEWKEVKRKQVAFSKARGRGERTSTRVDARVNCCAWGGSGKPLWHRFLAFYLQNPDGLSKTQFAKKDVDHTNNDPSVVDWRRLRIVEKHSGR